MNLVEIFGLLGTFAGALFGVLAALLLARWLLAAPSDPHAEADHQGVNDRERRISRILQAILRRSPH